MKETIKHYMCEMEGKVLHDQSSYSQEVVKQQSQMDILILKVSKVPELQQRLAQIEGSFSSWKEKNEKNKTVI